MDRHTCKHTLSVNAGWSRQPEADGDLPPNNKKVVKKKSLSYPHLILAETQDAKIVPSNKILLRVFRLD